MLASVRTRSATAATTPARRVHSVAVRASANSGVPANVQAAREWIAAWRAHSATPAAAAPTHAAHAAPAVARNVQEAREWIAAWRARSAAAPPPPPPAHAPVAHAAPAAAAPAPAPVKKATPSPPAASKPVISADGTITFSKQLLDSVTTDELLKSLAKKAERK